MRFIPALWVAVDSFVLLSIMHWHWMMGNMVVVVVVVVSHRQMLRVLQMMLRVALEL